MATQHDVEQYLIRLDLPFEEIGEGMWVIHDEYDNIENIVVHYTDPIVVFRVKLMELPQGDNTELFRLLLEHNATDMVHGAFGLEDSSIVVIDTLQVENLDFNEFQASVDALTLAITQHYPRLSQFRCSA